MTVPVRPHTSTRMADYRIDLIESVIDADDGMRWLDEQIAAMQGQLDYRAAQKTDDETWRSRVNLALTRARQLRHYTEKIRADMARDEKLERQRELERSFMDAAMTVLPKEDIKAIFDEMHRDE